MRYRKLGTCPFEVSEISLGCWTLGGPAWVKGEANGWAEVDECEATAAVHRGLEMGVTHFDNADIYGVGLAERRLAMALKGRCEEVTIATKVGWFNGTAAHPYEPQHIRHQCEQSLINLQREAIDLYYFHHGGFGDNDVYLDDAVAMMRTLRDEGKIRCIGLSAYSDDDFERLVPVIEPNALQSVASIMVQKFVKPCGTVERICKERGLNFVGFSPLNQGLLLDKFRPENPPSFAEGDHRSRNDKFHKPALEALAPKMDRMKERFGCEVHDLSRVALQFLLASDMVGTVIPGFRNVRQVECNLAGADQPLSADDMAFIREIFPTE